MVVKVLLDTNFLLDIVRFKIDFKDFNINEKTEFYITSSTLREIKSLINIKRKEGRFASIALKVIEIEGIKILESVRENVDEDLIELGKKYNFLIATNDKNLRKKLKMNNIKSICIKNKKRIEVIE
ncbi:MAG: hypothetical protein QXD89_02160 [Candidatus Aenigmatarchaeota archaeon]